MSSRAKSIIWTTVIVTGLVLFGSWADLFMTQLAVAFHQFFPALLIVVSVLLMVGGSWYIMDGAFPGNYFATADPHRTRAFRIAFGVAVPTILTGVVGGIIYLSTYNYYAARQYVGAIDQVNVPVSQIPTYEKRTPHPVAAASAESNLGGSTGSLVQDGTSNPQVTYVTGPTPTWNALVERLTIHWYEDSYESVLEQDLPLTGNMGTAHTCEFSPQADRRIDGIFGHSLERLIAHKIRFFTFDKSDVYGYCDGDRPIVVVPLKKIEGWLHPHEVPLAVAVYDGHTGEVAIHRSLKPGEIRGPVYPMSLAQRTRESATALGSWAERRRVGFDTSGSDPNRSEFVLATSNGDVSYVTPLTPQGSSKAVIAMSAVPANMFTTGKLNTLTVYRLPGVRKSNATVSSNIDATYGDLPEWKRNDIRIFEITPVTPLVWQASLGNDKNIIYRVLINADGSSCIEWASGAKIRCGKRTGEDGNGIGVALDGGNTGIPADLTNLTDEELVDLQAAVTREVLRRTNP